MSLLGAGGTEKDSLQAPAAGSNSGLYVEYLKGMLKFRPLFWLLILSKFGVGFEYLEISP